MVDNLVCRWPKPLFFMGFGGSWYKYLSTWNLKQPFIYIYKNGCFNGMIPNNQKKMLFNQISLYKKWLFGTARQIPGRSGFKKTHGWHESPINLHNILQSFPLAFSDGLFFTSANQTPHLCFKVRHLKHVSYWEVTFLCETD